MPQVGFVFALFTCAKTVTAARVGLKYRAVASPYSANAFKPSTSPLAGCTLWHDAAARPYTTFTAREPGLAVYPDSPVVLLANIAMSTRGVPRCNGLMRHHR
jgi:hypothetical protein